MHYEQAAVDREFRSLAMLADVRVQEFERNPPTSRSADQHDEALSEFNVYRFLHARPFMLTRVALLAELHWFQDAEVQVPANAYSAARFTSSRHSLVRKLIRRFECGEPPGLEPMAA
jgi:hypothetical protein